MCPEKNSFCLLSFFLQRVNVFAWAVAYNCILSGLLTPHKVHKKPLTLVLKETNLHWFLLPGCYCFPSGARPSWQSMFSCQNPEQSSLVILMSYCNLFRYLSLWLMAEGVCALSGLSYTPPPPQVFQFTYLIVSQLLNKQITLPS